MKQAIPPQSLPKEYYANNRRAHLLTVMHTGTTFWAQILQALLKQRYRAFHHAHIIDRIPGISKPGMVAVTMRHPLAVAVSWCNRGRFDGKWSNDLTRSWGLLCAFKADYVLSFDAPHRDDLLNKFLDDHDLVFEIDWSLAQNETKDWTKSQGMPSGERLRMALREGDTDYIFSKIDRSKYDALFELTNKHFPHYEYVPENWGDQRGSPPVASEGFSETKARSRA